MKPEDWTFLEGIEADLERMRKETDRVFKDIVLPTWEGELHGLSHVLYGLLARCFAYVDLLAALWKGEVGSGNQTTRMVSFLKQFLDYEHETANVAVQLWRHKLVHTTRPRLLKTEGGTILYHWLLQWGPPHLPRAQHMAFNKSDRRKVLGTGLVYLIEDLITGVQRYRQELEKEVALQRVFRAARPKIEVGIYKP